MQNKAKVKIGKMNASYFITKDYDKNNEQSTTNLFKTKPNKAKVKIGKIERMQETEFKSSILARQSPSQCYRPAGGNNDYHGQNYVSDLNFLEKTAQKPEIDAKNSYEESQNCPRNQRTAQQTGGRLDIKCFEDSALSERKYRGGHSAGRARKVVFLLEAAVAEPPAHIGFIVPGQSKQSEESNNRYANNSRYKSLARSCSTENFQLILLVCLHNYVRIDRHNSSVK